MNSANDVNVRRVYDAPDPGDGYRVLVDRLWPRGIAKATAPWDEWLKAVAPSNELRRWYKHEEQRFSEFNRRYLAELDDDEHAEALDRLRRLAEQGNITLLTATKDVEASHVTTLVRKLSESD